jgi:hypothetical protein
MLQTVLATVSPFAGRLDGVIEGWPKSHLFPSGAESAPITLRVALAWAPDACASSVSTRAATAEADIRNNMAAAINFRFMVFSSVGVESSEVRIRKNPSEIACVWHGQNVNYYPMGSLG